MTVEDSVPIEDSVSTEAGEKPKMRWLYVIAIGLGFFTTGVSWDVYDSFLPPDFLGHFITGDWALTIIALVMVLDNVLALLLQPYIGAKSDKTRTRIGRRLPFIMIGTPVAAMFFTLIAYGLVIDNFIVMMFAITIFNVAMAFYRAPVVALMPDVIPSVHRSKANGVINLMGGIGAIYAFGIASQIYKVQDTALASLFGIPVSLIGPFLTFLTTSIIMIVAVVLLLLVIREPEVPPEDTEKEIGVLDAFKQVYTATDKSAFYMLGAIFLWFFGYHSIKTWFTTYGGAVWNFSTADTTFLLTGLALSFVIFAVPAGLIAGRFGRISTIKYGLVGMVGCLTVIVFLDNYWAIFGMLAVAGFFWALININSIVVIWELFGKARLGAGTGLYYAFQMSAAIFGPLLAGVVFDLIGIRFMLPIGILFIGFSIVAMMAVERGEVGDELRSEVAA